MFHFGRRGCSSTTIPQSKIIDFCQLPLHKGAFGRYTAKLINNNLYYDTLICFRMVQMAPFSSRDTCACEIPSACATSIWVRPS